MADRTSIITDQLGRPYESLPGEVTPDMVASVEAKIPKAATMVPLSERVAPAAGENTDYARADHQHPRLTSVTYATFGTDGTIYVPFTRTFVNKPGLVLTETDATVDAQPIVLRGLGWTKDADGKFIGVTVQGRRSRMLPALDPVSGLLTAVITGINAITTALARFDLFAVPAAGATVSVIAIARSDVLAA